MDLLPPVSQVFMKRGVLQQLEQRRDQQVTGWLVHLQAACMGHLARQKYRKLKVGFQGAPGPDNHNLKTI